jgi:protoporphyrinogen oxidase
MLPRIRILGAGPTGLGAAIRCDELGHTNWKLYEKKTTAGGLAGTLRENKGFSWDFGGHVFLSKEEQEPLSTTQIFLPYSYPIPTCD